MLALLLRFRAKLLQRVIPEDIRIPLLEHVDHIDIRRTGLPWCRDPGPGKVG